MIAVSKRRYDSTLSKLLQPDGVVSLTFTSLGALLPAPTGSAIRLEGPGTGLHSSPSGNRNLGLSPYLDRNLNEFGRRFCDVSNDPSGFNKGREFHGQLSDHQRIK